MEVEQLPAENHLKWVVGKEEEEYEEEEATLQRRQSSQHRVDDVISAVVPSLSSSSLSSSTSSEVGGNSNGANPDGAPFQKEEVVAEMGNVNGNSYHSDGEQVGGAALGLAAMAELVGAATNGEAVTSTTAAAAASQNQNSVYFDKQEGFEANNGPSGVQNGNGARSVGLENHEDGEFNVQADSDQYVKTMDDECPSSSEISHLENSSLKATTIKDFNDEISTKAGPDLIEEIDQGLKELDVEAVLAKQETHDLFCPNCHSCITKRVILKKRKRHVPTLDPKAKRDKFDPSGSSTLVDTPECKSSQGDHTIPTPDVGSQEPPADHCNPETEREVFRCLSCFSFFIPSRNGFNIFRSIGGALKQNTSQNSSVMPTSILRSPPNMPMADLQSPLNMPAADLQTPSNMPAANSQSSNMLTSNANWFLSLFTSKGKIASDASLQHSKTDTAEQNHSSSIASNMLTSPEIGRPGGLVTDTTIVKKDSSSTQSYKQTDSNLANGSHKVGNDLSDFSGKEHIVTVTGNVRTKVGEEGNDSANIRKTDIVAISSSVNLSGDKLPLYEIDRLATSLTGETVVNIGEAAKDVVLTNNTIIDLQSSELDVKIPQIEKVNGDILEEIDSAVRKGKQGGDVIVPIEAEIVEGGVVTETPTQVLTDERQGADIGESQEWEVLKSIVYGGLVESITSLGVVSSAVGAGAAPLNIIALGLANLIGGLFVIGHNLIELKNAQSGGDLQQMDTQEDRYQELLGRRANFLLHAVVAILSFLIFGSVPLVVYGFLIRKNFYTEVKLAAVVAASLLCTILLAIGKAHTKRPPKSYFKTVLCYFTMAFAASGASYIVGGLIKKLLEKYNHSESGFVLNMPVSGRGSMEPAWMSY
ncbi:hypothetical protein L6164_029851 [Bauhinia variegata]|uniref:Uncharacterized protein n=1 Tax=Bauhinia variegata TaxID=167791 RepID=A0ACB9LAK8_BAUVA|nr:hypothetical protein L6164_029851 [Bauhinia variegata]